MKHLLILCVIASFLAFHGTCGTEQPRGRIESCPGCSLNRLQEVKKFVYDDIPKYEGLEFKKIQGAPPELVMFDDNDAEIERIPLKALNRQECNDLVISKGFKLKEDKPMREL